MQAAMVFGRIYMSKAVKGLKLRKEKKFTTIGGNSFYPVFNALYFLP